MPLGQGVTGGDWRGPRGACNAGHTPFAEATPSPYTQQVPAAPCFRKSSVLFGELNLSPTEYPEGLAINWAGPQGSLGTSESGEHETCSREGVMSPDLTSGQRKHADSPDSPVSQLAQPDPGSWAGRGECGWVILQAGQLGSSHSWPLTPQNVGWVWCTEGCWQRATEERVVQCF